MFPSKVFRAKLVLLVSGYDPIKTSQSIEKRKWKQRPSVLEQRSGYEDCTGLPGVCGERGPPSIDQRSGDVCKGVWFAVTASIPWSSLVTEEGEVIPGKKVKNLLKRHREYRVREEVREQRCQGKLVTERERGKELSAERCFWWLNHLRTCPTHTIAGTFELYEQLLPTRLCTIHKTRVSVWYSGTTRSHVYTVVQWYSCVVQRQRAWPTF